MKRFICYLYEYEQGKRIRNVGFAKVETGDEETIVHLQAKGFHDRGQKLGLYLFYEENGKIMRVWQEDIELATPSLSHHMMYGREDEKLKSVYGNIKGILIDVGNEKLVVATWDGSDIDVGRMEENIGSEILEIEETEKEMARVTKISRQEISKLPRCEWQLANNKFLMHGYHNYHHLLMIERGNDLKLGVPGIYHIKEAKCADMFGFDEFLTAEELGMQSEEEREMFGYWCRPVRRYHRL